MSSAVPLAGAGAVEGEAGAPSWRVHPGLAGSTCVRLACSSRGDADPWLLSGAVPGLLRLGAEREDRPHAVGGGRGQPLIHRQDLRWQGVLLELEAHHLAGGPDEVSLSLPDWDELAATVSEEAGLWEIVDLVAAAAGAELGSLGDGEAMHPSLLERAWAEALRHHVGILLPADAAAAVPPRVAAPYLQLPESGLLLLLR